MSSHITYACNCLNIKIYLANKYYLVGHEKSRREKYVRIKDPSISGWQFELNMMGVVVEYTSLIRVRYITNNLAEWITISCHNCTAVDIYSVKRPNAKFTYPIDPALLSQLGDQVIAHKGAIFGQEIDKIKAKEIYSKAFHIVLSPDLPAKHVLLDNEDESWGGPELIGQQKHMQRLLNQALIDLEEITGKRVQAYQQEQEILLIRDKRRTIYDGTVLLQTMKEVAKTMHEERQRRKRLSSHDSHTNNELAYRTLLKHILHDEDHNHVNHDTGENASKKEESNRDLQHVHFLYGNDTIHGNEEGRRSSSVFRREVFGGFAPSSYSSDRRRLSYALDESAIAHSLKKQHDHHELPPLYRRSSHILFNQYLHPLALAHNNTEDDDTAGINLAPAKITPSDNPLSREDKNDKGDDQVENDLGDESSSENESEDLSALDVDMDFDLDVAEQRRPSGRKLSTKYSEDPFDDADGNDDSVVDVSSKLRRQQQRHAPLNFATSVPIAINHPTPSALLFVKNEIGNDESPKNNMHPSSSFIEPTYLKVQQQQHQTRKPFFVGFDCAEADRRASSQFPPLDFNTSRRKSNVVNDGNKVNKNYTQYHHHHDPASRTSQNKIQIENLVFNEDDDEEEEHSNGLMIPPHILAANTVTDETEALFGSVPRNNIRNRPID